MFVWSRGFLCQLFWVFCNGFLTNDTIEVKQNENSLLFPVGLKSFENFIYKFIYVKGIRKSHQPSILSDVALMDFFSNFHSKIQIPQSSSSSSSSTLTHSKLLNSFFHHLKSTNFSILFGFCLKLFPVFFYSKCSTMLFPFDNFRAAAKNLFSQMPFSLFC